MSDFIEEIKHGAVKTWEKYGVLPSITLAQAALESAWGRSELAKKANNLFGIKAGADWSGATYTVETTEYIDGRYVKVDAAFRKYNSWDDSVIDHGAFFSSTPWRADNYKHFIAAKDYKTAAYALQAAGYATDPSYAEKIIEVIERNNLSQYDTEKGKPMPKHLIIAGHGMRRNGVYDPGAIGSGYSEADLVREYLIPAIRKYDGGKIDYITDHNVYDYQNICGFTGYETITELHFNSAASIASGTEVLIKAGYSADATDMALLEALSKYFVNRGIKQRSDLQNINLAAYCGLNYRLVETCFINNQADVNTFMENLDVIGRDLAKAITGVVVPEEKGDDEMKPEVAQWVEEQYKKAHETAPSDWAAESWDEATKEGIVDGSRPHAFLTRQEYAASELRRIKNE